MTESLRLLLISSSTAYPGGYLDHAEAELVSFLEAGAARAGDDVLFFPWALHDTAGYAAKARERLARMGLALRSIDDSPDPAAAIASAPAIFVGGGNTFRLLKALQDRRFLEPLRSRVLGGAPYVGSSAGTNIAGPTIRTTNDMPIVAPGRFDALGLVPFQINPHYLDPDAGSTHKGETRKRGSPSSTRSRRTRFPSSACARRRCCGGRAGVSFFAARRRPGSSFPMAAGENSIRARIFRICCPEGSQGSGSRNGKRKRETGNGKRRKQVFEGPAAAGRLAARKAWACRGAPHLTGGAFSICVVPASLARPWFRCRRSSAGSGPIRGLAPFFGEPHSDKNKENRRIIKYKIN